ncbi:MAG: sodC [Chloroflexi bacterium]|jgi:Cu-Zn family superoxide dismutase|nr:sodC [Chloroflexota bacterium]
MKKLVSLVMVIAMFMTFTLSTSLAAGQTATGEIKDKDGKALGTVNLTQTNDSTVRLEVKYNNLPPGTHGIHFHAVGKCEGPDFASAAGHFNPTSHKHGLDNPDGGHAGDLPNLVVPAGGSGTFTATSQQISLMDGPNKLIGQNGAALVIHANADDQKTDPAGNSGARIACAVLSAAPANLPASGLGGASSSSNNLFWILPACLGIFLAAGLGGLVIARRNLR